MSLLLSLLLAAPVRAELTPEQKKAMIQEHYQRAFDLLKREEHSRAIQHWEAVLQLDGEQKSAKSLIEQARRSLADRLRKETSAMYDLVERGAYSRAHEALLKLLEADPTHPGFTSLMGKLDSVRSVAPDASAKGGTAWKAARLALHAYLGRREDLKLAYDGLRHAADLAPKDPEIKTLLEDFETRHPDVVRANRITPGMEILEHKRFTVLSRIYDGRYPEAIDVCHEILALEPDDVLTLKRMGSAYFAMKKREKAAEYWRRAMKLAPKDEQLKDFLDQATRPESVRR